MDKTEAIALFKQSSGKIPHLRNLYYRNDEFKSWKESVLRILEQIYGKDSPEYRRFLNAPGTSFSVGTESGREQAYQYQLDCYEEVLNGLVSGKS